MKHFIKIITTLSIVVFLVACSEDSNPVGNNDLITEPAVAVNNNPELGSIAIGGNENLIVNGNVDPDPEDIRLGVIQNKRAFNDQTKSEYLYPQYTSVTVEFNSDQSRYKHAKCRLPNGSIFEIKQGDLTPPADHPWGEPVTITMKAELIPTSGELVFTFGPSGCQFDASAHVSFKWADLSSPLADLFYIDADGNYIEHLPDNIDIKNKKMHLYIDHFSRYSVAYAE